MTKKQKITAVLALAFAFSLGMAVMCGCSYFTQEKVAEIHKTVGTILDIAYTSGGAVLVEQKIDQLVADGKITAQQGEMLKEAARRSYEALQEKLAELFDSEKVSVMDIDNACKWVNSQEKGTYFFCGSLYLVSRILDIKDNISENSNAKV